MDQLHLQEARVEDGQRRGGDAPADHDPEGEDPDEVAKAVTIVPAATSDLQEQNKEADPNHRRAPSQEEEADEQ